MTITAVFYLSSVCNLCKATKVFLITSSKKSTLSTLAHVQQSTMFIKYEIHAQSFEAVSWCVCLDTSPSDATLVDCVN